MNVDEGLVECSTSPDAAHEYWKALEEDDMMFALSPETGRRMVEKAKGMPQLVDNKFFPIKVESSAEQIQTSQGCYSSMHPAYPQHSLNLDACAQPWTDNHYMSQSTMVERQQQPQLPFDPSMFPSDFLNYAPNQAASYEFHQQPMASQHHMALPNEPCEEYSNKIRTSGQQQTRIVTPSTTVPRTKQRKRRKRSPSSDAQDDTQQEGGATCERGERRVCSSKEVESLLKQLGGGGEVTLHVYENAQRLYIRYVNESGMWQMRDVADFVNVKFHSDSDVSMPEPPPAAPAENVSMATESQLCQMNNDNNNLMALIPANQHQQQYTTIGVPTCPVVPITTLPDNIFSMGMMGEMVPAYPGTTTPCMVVPQVKELSRDLVLEFKRKEHYWRRGIWVRVVVDVVAKGGNGTPVREAGGSINVALLSVKGKVIKKACEKCSKYYFRYKNIESTGQAPAFEIEERERCTAVRGGRASFNMRVWECSHHYLSPHTLLFSWVDPCNPCMRTVALCPKEIVISSGSGQEKKLKEMTVSREEVFRDFADALIMMESAQYCRAIEALRCIRWKCFHFLGVGLPSIVDEKIGDCFLRMGDYRGAIEHFARSMGHLNKAKDRMEPTIYLLMRALLYLKLSNSAYSRERDSVQVMNLKKCSKTLRKSRDAFQRALELEMIQQAELLQQQGEKEGDNNNLNNLNNMNNLNNLNGAAQKDSTLLNFVKNYLQFAYHQSMTGLYLKMKPFQLAMGDLAGSITYEAIAQGMEEAEKNLICLQKEDKTWFSTDMLTIFGPLVEKLHTGVDSLKKLLHSPFATNKVITQFSLMSEQSPQMSHEQLGERMLSVLRELKQAADEAEELHPKGHRTICICKCLLALFMYLGGQLTREEALRSVEEILRQIEKFWKTNGGVGGGRFECQQVASIGEYIRSNQRNIGNPFAVFDDREHMQLYRMWIHSPLDIAVWALQVQVTWG